MFMFELPDVISNEVFCTWISLVDLAYLDSAMTNNHTDRTFLLGLISHRYFVFESNSNGSDDRKTFSNPSAFDWIQLRQIKLKKYFLNGLKLPLQLFDFESHVDMSKCATIFLSNCRRTLISEQFVRRLISESPQLISLTLMKVVCVTNTFFNEVIPERLQQLKEISIINCSNKGGADIDPTLSILTRHCKKLSKFASSLVGDALHYSSLFTSNKATLTQLTLSVAVDDILFESITSIPFRQLSELKLTWVANFKLTSLTSLLQLATLKAVDLTGYNAVLVYKVSEGTKSISITRLRDDDNNPIHLQSFFTQITHFNVIQLSKVITLHDQTLQNISENNPQLHIVSIESCGHEFTHHSLQNILVSCSELHTLTLNDANNIQDNDFESLFSSNVSLCLTTLHIAHHNTIATETVNRILMVVPSITKLFLHHSALVWPQSVREYSKAVLGRTVRVYQQTYPLWD